MRKQRGTELLKAEVLLKGSQACAGRERTRGMPEQLSSAERGGGESSVAANVAKAIYMIRDQFLAAFSVFCSVCI